MIAKGFRGLGAFKKASTWGTPVACGAGDGVEILSEAIAAAVALIEDMQIAGAQFQREGDAGNRLFSGSFLTGARYEGLEPLLAQAFGTAGAPTTVDTSARKHVFKPNNDLEGIFGTLVFDKKVFLHEFTTVKITGFRLRISQGGRAEIEFRCAAHNLNENAGSGTNNTTTFATVTLPANREFLQFRQMVVRINAQGGAALGASDVRYVSELEIEVDRNFKIDDVTTRFGNAIDEPTQNGFASVRGSLRFSKYQDGTGGNAADFTASLSKARQKMDIVFTADALAGAVSQKFQWLFYLPNVQFGEATPNIGGPGVIEWTLPFMGYRVLTIPTGFPTGYIDAVTMEVISQRATDALA